MVRSIQSIFGFAFFTFAIFILTTSTVAAAQYATVGPNGGVVILSGPAVVPSEITEPSRVGISLIDRAGIANYSGNHVEVATIGEGRAAFNGAALGTSELPAEGYVSEQGKVHPKERDGGASVFVGEGPVSGTARAGAVGPTLAELAAKIKASGAKSKRTYTNADAQRINDNLQMKQMHTNQPNNPPPPR
jgi:hypothetical protein